MTFCVPLACTGAGRSNTHASNAAIINPPSTLPPFVRSSTTPEEHLSSVFDSILKAKRVAVVCGAGISVEAGIPDFRSPDGLFQSLKRDNPKESLTSGKDLFDASVFKSTTKTALFYQMIASLASVSSQSEPTSFHKLLRALDDNGQLLRVYTQNIDALEMKAGLSFGVPEFEERFLRSTGRMGKTKGKGKANTKPDEQGGNNTVAATDLVKTSLKKGKTTKNRGKREPESGSYSYSVRKRKKISLGHPEFNAVSHSQGSAEQRPLVSISEESTSVIDPTFRPPLNTIPRCIPLHGTLLTLHCQHCTQTYPLNPPPPSSSVQSQTPPRSITSSPDPFHTPQPVSQEDCGSPTDNTDLSPYMLHTLLTQGTPPPCPSCTSLEQTRALVGKRLRGVGRLRPSVVLYGEEHREGEGVGEAVRRDLCGIEVETVQVGGNGDLKDQTVAAQDVQTAEAASYTVDTVLSNTESSITPISSTPSKSKLRARTRSTRKGPDLLLVVGTSLRVPGTKRIVREFSKAVKSTSSSSNSGSNSGPTPESSASTSPVLGTSHLPTPTPPPPPDETLHELTTPTKTSRSSTTRNSSSSSSKQKIKTIYINNEFPLSNREWEGVFDVWVQGDVQVFARAVAALMQDQTVGSSSETNHNTVVDEDVSVNVEEEGVAEVPKKKVKQKRKLGDEEGDTIQETAKKKKKKRGTDSLTKPESNIEKTFPLTPPATVHRPTSGHTSKFSSNTVAGLGPVIWNPSTDVSENIEEVFEDPLDKIIDCPGFQMSQIDDLDINVVADTDSEEPELDGMGIGNKSSALHTTSTYVFSPAPTPPPTTKKKRKVILKLPPCDSSSSYSTSSDPFLESNMRITTASQLMDLDIPSRSTTTRGKTDTHDDPVYPSSHFHSTVWQCSTPILELSTVLPSMTTYASDISTTNPCHLEYYANPSTTSYPRRPHLNLHSSSPLSSLTSLSSSSSSSRRPSSGAPAELKVVASGSGSGSGSGSSPTSMPSHRNCNSPPLPLTDDISASALYMSYDDAYGFTDESERFGWEGLFDGVLPVYA